MPKNYLDLTGLEIYHSGVVSALKQKENKFHIGDTEPTDSWVTTWFDVGDDVIEDEVSEVSLLSEESDELHFESDGEEELTYNTIDETEELTFNSDIE